MDLKSGYPYWAVKNGLMHAFPPLQTDATCDVAVIGAGIGGALIADDLARHDHEVLVIDQRDVGWGSTSASTALLQYEIDTHMVDLARQLGEDQAVLAYRACAEAIPQLQRLAQEVRDVDFKRMQSLYYASKRGHVGPLQQECALRHRHGFAVRWVDREEVRADYGIEAPGAILSDLAAIVDPYRLTYRLLQRLQKRGTAVHDRTAVTGLEPTPRGVTLRLDNGHRIRARHVVVAAGYASQAWLKQRVARNRSSYACITDPIAAEALGALAHTMIWESARPYLYMRSTGDGRLLVGGEDDAVDVPAKRDARVGKKSRILLKQVRQHFPHLDVEPVFAWAGTFAETADGLPFFGPHAQYGPRVHFAMAYGGNGITYAMIGAGMIRALIERRPHPLSALFSFDRLD